MLTSVRGHTLWSSLIKPGSCVLDLGANRGDFSRLMVKRFGVRCIAAEANPALARGISESGVEVRNVAIAGENGTATLHLVDGNLESSSLLRSGGKTVDVPCVKLTDFAAGLSPSLIKFDIEGAELAAIAACPDDFLRSVPQITVEFHDAQGLTPDAEVRKVVARLESLGFFTLKMWRSGWGDTLFVNRRNVSAPWLWLANNVERHARKAMQIVVKPRH